MRRYPTTAATKKTSAKPLDVERELDEVVGPYDERRGQRALERFGRIAARVLLGASLALAAATVVVYTLHTHVKRAQTAPAPQKAVPIHIVPAQR